MKNLTKMDGMAIIDHYKSLDTEQRVALRGEIMAVTGISYSSFYYKISARTKFSNSEIIVINSIIRKHHAAQD